MDQVQNNVKADRFWKNTFYTLALTSISIGLFIAVSDHNATLVVTLCFAVGVVILVIQNIDKLEFFKGFGFEAKSKELDLKIDKADKLYEQVKSAAQLVAEISVQLIPKLTKLNASFSNEENESNLFKLRKLLSIIGTNEAEIEQAVKPLLEIKKL